MSFKRIAILTLALVGLVFLSAPQARAQREKHTTPITPAGVPDELPESGNPANPANLVDALPWQIIPSCADGLLCQPIAREARTPSTSGARSTNTETA